MSVFFIVRVVHEYSLLEQFYVLGGFAVVDEIAGGEDWSIVDLTAPHRVF